MTDGFYYPNDTIDINIHDTYFIFRKIDISILISILLFSYGITYWLIQHFNRKSNFYLSVIHTFSTLGSLIFIKLIPSKIFERRYYTIINSPYTDNSLLLDYNAIIIVVTLFFIVSQLFLIINVIISLSSKRE